MPKLHYKSLRVSPDDLQMIRHADRIATEYYRQGNNMTLRGIYYKFVARNLFPEDRRWRQIPGTNKWERDPNGTKNAEPNYKWLGTLVTKGRLMGLIDWNMIVDSTRYLRRQPSWDSPADIISACAGQFQVDLWENQPYRVEVWIEKDAQLTFFEGPCAEFNLPLFSCRGYSSITGLWQASQRLIGYKKKKQTPVILHFGDHDPSGVDMSRDIVDRLYTFLAREMEFERLALNMGQIEEHHAADPNSLPPAPAKITDSRAKAYIEEYGDEAWELDALEPEYIRNLIEGAVERYADEIIMDAARKKQAEHRATLELISDNYDSVEEHVRAL